MSQSEERQKVFMHILAYIHVAIYVLTNTIHYYCFPLHVELIQRPSFFYSFFYT